MTEKKRGGDSGMTEGGKFCYNSVVSSRFSNCVIPHEMWDLVFVCCFFVRERN